MKFVGGDLGLAHGLIQLGLKPGDVVAISALNRYIKCTTFIALGACIEESLFMINSLNIKSSYIICELKN